MVETAALTLVAAAGLFFILLGGASLAAPSYASRFLLGFADSAPKHFAELLLRALIGAAFVLAAPRLPFPLIFSGFGWVLLASTALLLLIPWRWHHHFARRAVPEALRFLPLIGASSVALGGFVLWVVVRGGTA